MKKNIVHLLFLSTVLSICMIACRKNETNLESNSAIDNGIADNYFNDVYSVVNNAAANNGFAGLAQSQSSYKIMSSDCPVVTFSEPFGTFPNTMTIDFGDGCISYFGLERKGKIISTFTGLYKAEGTIIIITTDEYYVNGAKVEGTKTITNLGLNDLGNMHFSVSVVDAKITLTGGELIQWDSERDREWIEGIDSEIISDDVYSISGGSEGINRFDTPFTVTILSALRKEMDCNWIVSGSLEIKPEGEETRTIDYGDGSCDNEALLTIGSYSTTITLPF